MSIEQSGPGGPVGLTEAENRRVQYLIAAKALLERKGSFGIGGVSALDMLTVAVYIETGLHPFDYDCPDEDEDEPPEEAEPADEDPDREWLPEGNLGDLPRGYPRDRPEHGDSRLLNHAGLAKIRSWADAERSGVRWDDRGLGRIVLPAQQEG